MVLRIGLVLALLMCAVGCAANEVSTPSSSSAARSEEMAAMVASIRTEADGAGARVGVVAHPLESGSGVTVRVNDGDRFALLSTFKVYACAALLRKVGSGPGLDRTVPVLPAEVVNYSPVTGPAVGTSMSLRQLCDAALTQSDNTAGNLIMREIGGPAAVTAFARSVGDGETRLDRWETDLNTAFPGDPRDTTTAAGLAAGFGRLLSGAALNDAATRTLLGWMRDTRTSATRMRAGLPPGWTSADKTGGGDYGSTNDAGLVIAPSGHRYLLVVLTRDRADRRDAPAFGPLIAAIAKATTPIAEW